MAGIRPLPGSGQSSDSKIFAMMEQRAKQRKLKQEELQEGNLATQPIAPPPEPIVRPTIISIQYKGSEENAKSYNIPVSIFSSDEEVKPSYSIEEDVELNNPEKVMDIFSEIANKTGKYENLIKNPELLKDVLKIADFLQIDKVKIFEILNTWQKENIIFPNSEDSIVIMKKTDLLEKLKKNVKEDSEVYKIIAEKIKQGDFKEITEENLDIPGLKIDVKDIPLEIIHYLAVDENEQEKLSEQYKKKDITKLWEYWCVAEKYTQESLKKVLESIIQEKIISLSTELDENKINSLTELLKKIDGNTFEFSQVIKNKLVHLILKNKDKFSLDEIPEKIKLLINNLSTLNNEEMINQIIFNNILVIKAGNNDVSSACKLIEKFGDFVSAISIQGFDFKKGRLLLFERRQKSFDSLLKSLEDLKHITSLDLSNNQISAHKTQQLLGIISKDSSLQYLNLYGNQIGAEGCAFISEYADNLQNLKELNIGRNNVGDKGIEKLKLGKFQLSALDLSNNNITKKGIIVMKKFKEITKFERLDLSFNLLDDSALSELVVPDSLKELYLYGCGFSKLTTLRNLLNKVPEGLEILDLGNTEILKHGWFSSKKNAFEGLTRLKKLTHLGLSQLSSELVTELNDKIPLTIKILTLNDCDFNEGNAEAFSEKLKTLSSLENIMISNSHLNDNLTPTILNSLATLAQKKLKKINLSKNNITDETIIGLKNKHKQVGLDKVNIIFDAQKPGADENDN